MMPSQKDLLINNILAEVCKSTDISREQYIPWLKSEIGMTDEDITYLKAVNCLPEPC